MAKKTRATNEFTILPMGCIDKNATALIKYSSKNWNDVVKSQLQRKLVEGRKSIDCLHHGNPVRIDVHFQNGTVSVFLFIHEFYSLFEVHEAARDAFRATIIGDNTFEFRNISFNLMFLSPRYFPNGKVHWSQSDLVDALSSLVVLSQWAPPCYGTIKYPKKEKAIFGFYTDLPKDQVGEIIREAEVKALGTNQVRTLAMMPANKLGSQELVEYAMKAGSKIKKVESTFLDYSALKEMGAGAFCAVLQSAPSKGGIVKLHRPGKTRPIVLIGKGVVFDTGGLDVKTEGSMLGMHRDMTGAAVALSTFEALAELRPEMNLTCYLAVGENLISPESYKPGDVIKTLSGKVMEIENTDAEGRLLLVDTIALANKEHSRMDAVIIDFATLTGAALEVAGNKRAVVTTNQERMWPNIIKSGKRSGERVVTLPIDDEFRDAVTATKIADVSQCTGFTAEHCYAGSLLSYFVDDKKLHVHVDLACEFREGGLGLASSNVSGFGVRWAVDFVLRSIGFHSK